MGPKEGGSEKVWEWGAALTSRLRSFETEMLASAYNRHFEFAYYHPLLLFNPALRDCLAGKLRPGNVHSAENWEKVLLSEIERQQKLGEALRESPCPEEAEVAPFLARPPAPFGLRWARRRRSGWKKR